MIRSQVAAHPTRFALIDSLPQPSPSSDVFLPEDSMKRTMKTGCLAEEGGQEKRSTLQIDSKKFPSKRVLFLSFTVVDFLKAEGVV